MSTTVGSRSISSNNACLIASRKVTCAISVWPFSQPQPLSSPSFLQRLLRRYSMRSLLPSVRAFPCRQNESARFRRLNLFHFQNLPRSKLLGRSTLAESLPPQGV